MKNICLYFQIHHPFSFQTFRYFDVGGSRSYYDDIAIEQEIQEVANNYYIPANSFLLKLIKQAKGQLKLSFYISGTVLDQLLLYFPRLINSFRELADTGQVEFTGGTGSHSVASLAEGKDEFISQIKINRERIKFYFGQNPKVFVNTDLIYTNQIAEIIAKEGYPAILTNGAKKLLQWRSPDYLYSCKNNVNLILRNEVVSNEFSNLLKNFESLGKPESMKLIYSSLKTTKPEEACINIYLNYMSMGGLGMNEKHRYFKKFISKIIHDSSFCFSLPSELIQQFFPVAEIGTNEPVCWKEGFHSSYYPGNDLQKEAIKHLFKLEKKVKNIENSNLKIDWRYLQTSDHFHLMDENHPNYGNKETSAGIYKSKYDAFINYMNILEDFRLRLKAEKRKEKNRKHFQQPVHFHQTKMDHIS